MFALVYPTWRTPLGLPFFDYEVPAPLETQIKIGQLVTIPFRNKEAFGVVGGLTDKPSMLVKNIKAIESIVHPEPFISSPQMAFLQELSELYHVSPGFLLQGNLPPLQKRKLRGVKNEELRIKNLGTKPQTFTKPTLFTYKNNEEKRKYLNEIITKDGQTLIIVPEINDIASLVPLIPNSCSLILTTITSDLSDKELFERWFQVWSGEKKIIVGTRRALFMSFYNLQSVVVDDEGSSGHKSWDMAPRFHAREAALYLAKHHGAQLHLMSYTPSLESYYFAKHGVFNRHPHENVEPAAQPLSVLDSRLRGNDKTKNERMLAVDMTGETRAGNKTGLCQEAQDAITELQSGFVFLFLNRRGSGGYVHCKECGNVLKCKKCGRSFIYHEKKNELACHFCKVTEPMVVECSKCGGTYMSVFGTGTEQLERDVKKIAGDIPVYRIDSDAVGTENFLPLRSNKGIIIATEYGWQKVPWNTITTMVFVDPDTSLFIPEYRAAEELWQIINNALHRLSENAHVVIQNKHPEHTIYTSLSTADQFYESELKQRRLFGYPPFNYILKLFNSAASPSESKYAAENLYRKLAILTKNIANCTITPPLESSPFYHDKKYWHVLVIKVPYTHYKRDIRTILKHVPDSWKVDLNPNSLLGW